MHSELSRPRAIAHVDLVEVQRNPSALQGQPVVVVQYNPFGDLTTLLPEQPREFPDSNGSIIAVSYEARRFGVKRNMMAQEGKKLCPNLHIVQVPVAHGKADLTIYREAGAQVAAILSRMSVCERASIDEVYLDVTEAAAARLAGLPAGSCPPAPASFEGVHVLGASNAGADLDSDDEHVNDGLLTDDDKSCDWSDDEGHKVSGQDMQPAAERADAASTPTIASVTPDKTKKAHAPAETAVTLGPVTAAHAVDSASTTVAASHAASIIAAASAAKTWWCRPAAEWAPHEPLLAAAAQVVWELRQAVRNELGYTCSAGISHYRILAKLGSGMHKPAQQTIVPAASVPIVLKDLPLSKLRGLGGQFGRLVSQQLGVDTCGGVWDVPVSRLETLFGKRGPWLSRLVWGIDTENDIKPRMLPKQISCGKTFRGHTALRDIDSVAHWLAELAGEVADRCETDRKENQRMPSNLAVAITNQHGGDGSTATNFTRSCPLSTQPTAHALAATAVQLFKKWAAERPGWRVTSLFLTAGNFMAAPNTTITRFFAAKQGPSVSAASSAANVHTSASKAGSVAAGTAHKAAAAAVTDVSAPAAAVTDVSAPAAAASSTPRLSQRSPHKPQQDLNTSQQQQPAHNQQHHNTTGNVARCAAPFQVLYPPKPQPAATMPVELQPTVAGLGVMHQDQQSSLPSSQPLASLASWLPVSQGEGQADVNTTLPCHELTRQFSAPQSFVNQAVAASSLMSYHPSAGGPECKLVPAAGTDVAEPRNVTTQQVQTNSAVQVDGSSAQQAWREVSGWDVDQAVLAELPKDIQAEIRASLHLPPMQLSRAGHVGLHAPEAVAGLAGASSRGPSPSTAGGKRAHSSQGPAQARPSKSIRAFFSGSKHEK